MSAHQKVCDRDCFHCPYPDCIVDDVTHQEYQALSTIDKLLTFDPRKARLVAQHRAYYQVNKYKIAAQRLARREKKERQGGCGKI